MNKHLISILFAIFLFFFVPSQVYSQQDQISYTATLTNGLKISIEVAVNDEGKPVITSVQELYNESDTTTVMAGYLVGFIHGCLLSTPEEYKETCYPPYSPELNLDLQELSDLTEAIYNALASTSPDTSDAFEKNTSIILELLDGEYGNWISEYKKDSSTSVNSMSSQTPVPLATSKLTETSIPTNTPTPTATNTYTPKPTITSTSIAIPTQTPQSTLVVTADVTNSPNNENPVTVGDVLSVDSTSSQSTNTPVSTPLPTITPVPTLDAKSSFEVRVNELAKTEVFGVDNLQVEVVDMSPIGVDGYDVYLTWKLSNGWSDEQFNRSARFAVRNILVAFNESDIVNYNELILFADAELVDKFGNVSTDRVLKAVYHKDLVSRINPDYFVSSDVFAITDNYWLHPVLRD